MVFNMRLILIYADLHFVPVGSDSRGEDAAFYVLDMNQPSLPTHFYPVLVSVSVLMALSTVFHSIDCPDNSRFSHSYSSGLNSALLVASTVYLFMKVSLSPDIIRCS